MLNSAFLWSAMRSSSAEEQNEDSIGRLESNRNEVSALLEEFAVGRNSNAKDSVRQEVSMVRPDNIVQMLTVILSGAVLPCHVVHRSETSD